jgi:hypothetical protein
MRAVSLPVKNDYPVRAVTGAGVPYATGFYILVTGAVPSSEILNINLTHVTEYVPVDNFVQMAPREMAIPGPAT